MQSLIKRIYTYTFYLLFFFVPLVLFPKTSELFEFNKLVLTYLLTTIILFGWVAEIILEKKIVFKRTTLDIPLLIFLSSQILSTFVSVDSRTSLLGYYSRFHGGLLSTAVYLLLYWSFVSLMDRKSTLKSIKTLLASAFLVTVYGILEHFGIDKDVWAQDVQLRVFSTLGQPNWLAAWLTALIPIAWSLGLKFNNKSKRFINFNRNLIWLLISLMLFLTLLFTKSRSGIFGFFVAAALYWPLTIFFTWKKGKVKVSIIQNILFVLLATSITIILVGTPWTLPLKNMLKQDSPVVLEGNPQKLQGPALEAGGTDSGEIRKIVWKGALGVWKAYPVLGSGVETFAFSYYKFRPVEHNLVSEWDFLYNKAHNEYLNFAATSGTIGLLSYLGLIVFSILQITSINKSTYKNIANSGTNNIICTNSLEETNVFSVQNLKLGLLSGYSSILVTNFFGFSVVPVAILFFLFPAFAVTLEEKSKRIEESKKAINITLPQKIILLFTLSFTLFLFYSICKYWYSDYLYAQGKSYNDSNYAVSAQQYLRRAIKYSPKETNYWDELSQTDANIAVAYFRQDNKGEAKQLAEIAVAESIKASQLSPANVNILRNQAGTYLKLTEVDINYIFKARDSLKTAAQLAPTEAKIIFNYALILIRTGSEEEGFKLLEKTVKMKPNYQDARMAYALTLIEKGENTKAKEQLDYILNFINPNHTEAKEELEKLK